MYILVYNAFVCNDICSIGCLQIFTFIDNLILNLQQCICCFDRYIDLSDLLTFVLSLAVFSLVACHNPLQNLASGSVR